MKQDKNIINHIELYIDDEYVGLVEKAETIVDNQFVRFEKTSSDVTYKFDLKDKDNNVLTLYKNEKYKNIELQDKIDELEMLVVQQKLSYDELKRKYENLEKGYDLCYKSYNDVSIKYDKLKSDYDDLDTKYIFTMDTASAFLNICHRKFGTSNIESQLINSIKKVYFNNPTTVVLFNDGSKIVSKCGKDDIYDEGIGLAVCLAKKLFGNGSQFSKYVNKIKKENQALLDKKNKNKKNKSKKEVTTKKGSK